MSTELTAKDWNECYDIYANLYQFFDKFLRIHGDRFHVVNVGIKKIDLTRYIT